MTYSYAKVLLIAKELIIVMNETEIKLSNSPIYNLSMCSLENFHTCFFKWLGQNYPRQFLNVLLNKNVPAHVNVEFETQVRYSNDTILDLQITVNDRKETEFIVIENKLKSYPTQEQLIKYQNYFREKKSTFILLSLVPNFEASEGWQYISYENLAEKLSQISEFKNQYDEFLITDYINVVKLIANAFPKISTQKYDFYEENKLDEIGLKDIYVKWRTSEFANCIKQKLNRADWDIGFSFHNKKGTIDIVKSFPEYGFNIGIQIENNQYRYFMIIPCDTVFTNKKEVREKIASELHCNGYWFNNTQDTKRNILYKEFCGYNPDFIYRYFTLEKHYGVSSLKDISYEDIVRQIEKDINNLEENQHEIIRIIAENL